MYVLHVCNTIHACAVQLSCRRCHVGATFQSYAALVGQQFMCAVGDDVKIQCWCTSVNAPHLYKEGGRTSRATTVYGNGERRLKCWMTGPI